MKFLDDNFFFSKHQFGFLKGKSTSDAQFFVNMYINENLDKSERLLGIFLDIKKAFDCVNHDILLKKLNYAGIGGNKNNWIRYQLLIKN